MSEVIYTNWEFHPKHGNYSRLVFTLVKKDTYTMTREYKTLKGE